MIANAGRGLRHGFLDEDFDKARHVIDTNIVGTVYLVQKVGRDMRAAEKRKLLLTGSIAGFMPGTFQAVYNGTKAFVNSFEFALRNELKDTEVTVTCLMPAATETRFFERAEMLDTKVGQQEKDDPSDVAKSGWDAMMRGGWRHCQRPENKIQSAVANITPAGMLAEQHRKMATWLGEALSPHRTRALREGCMKKLTGSCSCGGIKLRVLASTTSHGPCLPLFAPCLLIRCRNWLRFGRALGPEKDRKNDKYGR